MVIILHERSECRRNFREPPENGLPGTAALFPDGSYLARPALP